MSGVPLGFGHVAHAPKIHRTTGSGGSSAITGAEHKLEHRFRLTTGEVSSNLVHFFGPRANQHTRHSHYLWFAWRQVANALFCR